MTKRLTFRQRWVKALRSGKYRQAKGVLRSPDNDVSYCCLGVACDLIDPNKWTKHAKEGDGALRAFAWGRRGRDSDYDDFSLPGHKAREVIGMDDEAIAALAELNDEGYSFTDIADAIEWIDNGESPYQVQNKLSNRRNGEAA